jgi:hypothetical protein
MLKRKQQQYQTETRKVSNMPKVGKKEFPYTVKGKAAAATARKKQMANDKKMKSKKGM